MSPLTHPSSGQPRGRPWWAIGLLALSALWMLFCACMFVTGYSATVTVTGGQGDGFCDVVWRDESGTTLRGESDCYDEPAGSRFEVRVSGWPDPGEPTLTETYVGIALLFGLPPAGVAGIGLHLRRRRRRLGEMPELATRATGEDAPDAAASVERTATALARAGLLAWGVLAVAVVAGCALVGLIWASIDGDTDLRDNGVTTVGTIVRVDPDGKWDPGGASVRFTAGQDTSARYVSLGSYADEYEEGQTVVVVYDRSDPRRFTIDDVLYETELMTWTMGAVCAVAALSGFLGPSWLSAHRQVRRLLRTRAWTPERVRVLPDDRGLTFTTADGVCWSALSARDWPEPNREPRQLSGWGLPDEDPADVPFDQAAWWVCDGTTAVFSPDQGAPLVAARRRSQS